MILWRYEVSQALDSWADKIEQFVNQVTSSPAFPAISTLVLFAIACWAISYFSRK